MKFEIDARPCVLQRKTRPIAASARGSSHHRPAMAAPRKVIIDTDPGIDDSMCIFMALRSMDPAFRAAHPTYTPLDVVGLTTVFGAISLTS